MRRQILFQLLLQFILECKSKRIIKMVHVCQGYHKTTVCFLTHSVFIIQTTIITRFSKKCEVPCTRSLMYSWSNSAGHDNLVRGSLISRRSRKSRRSGGNSLGHRTGLWTTMSISRYKPSAKNGGSPMNSSYRIHANALQIESSLAVNYQSSHDSSQHETAPASVSATRVGKIMIKK